MNEVNVRPSFFPNSPSSQTAKSKGRNDIFDGDMTTGKSNSPTRMEELNASTADHVRVDIPESIKDYSTIKKAVDQSGPVDNSAKIAAIKNRIQNGTYNVDYDAVANKMLTDEF